MILLRGEKMDYTVKQLATLAGVSARTLHYYDEIGLLKPSSHGENGYRYYRDDALLRLQQILFYKELDIALEEIRAIIDSPEFDILAALQTHREALEGRIQRLDHLIHTVDQTILYLKGKTIMSKKQLFEGFDEGKQKQYEQEIRERYGERALDGVTDWNSYTPAQKDKIRAEGEAVYQELLANMGKGYDSPEVQSAVSRWHQHLRYFYEPSKERLLGLGQLYVDHPDFNATFTRMHPDLPAFLQKAIRYYVEHMKG